MKFGNWARLGTGLIALLLVSLAAVPSLGCAEKSTAELLQEIRSLKQDVLSGKVVLSWKPGPHSKYANDPLLIFDSLEETVLAPDVAVYLKTSAGDAAALHAEIAGWPQVEQVTFISKNDAFARFKQEAERQPGMLYSVGPEAFPTSLEIYLKDRKTAKQVAGRLSGRPEIDQVQTPDKSTVETTLKILRDSAHGGGE